MDIKDVIKIAYAWIGPRGPIWNTELPNILSFAGVAEAAQVNSINFWCDDLWRKLFLNKKEEYVLYPIFELNEKDIFIYPFSLTWRVPFTSYFYGRTGLLEYAHCSGTVLHHVRSNNGFFLIDMSVEAYARDEHLSSMHTYFNTIHNIPLNKIIYLTGCMNASKIYEDFCNRRNIPNRPDARMNVISYPSAQNVFHSQLQTGWLNEPQYNTEQIPQKTFLCWNRRFRPHRTELSLALDKANLIDRSYYSLGLFDPENPDGRFQNTISIHSNPGLNLTNEDALKLINKLPLTIDNKNDIIEMCEDRNMEARNFYQNSLVSIVTETNYNLPEVTLTEKSFKPAKEKHPFIIVGVDGVIQSMRDLGFKTFSDFWSEEYDTIKCPNLRMVEIIRVCKEIGAWDNNKIIDFKRRVKPILDHNFDVLKKSPSDSLSEKINEVVRKNIK
jgi:hypothetical protein